MSRDLGPITDDTCMLFASPGTGQPDKILTWLQLKDVDYSKGVTFPFEDTRTGPEVINPLEVRNRKRAFAAGTLRIINILPLQDGVRLMFMTPRPAKPAPNAAAHPSPP